MFLILFLLLCCLVTVWVYIKISSKINVLVPKLPKALNFVEFGIFKFSFNDLFKRITYMGEYTNENGGVTRFNYGPVTVYVVSDAEDMVTVLNKCTKKMFLYDMIKPYVGSQLVAAEFPVWKRNRRLLDLAFKPNILNGYMDIFNAQVNDLAAAMVREVNKETNFISLIGRNMLETTCQRPIRVMAKNLQSSCTSARILGDISDKGYNIQDVTNKLSWRNKEPLNMFILPFDQVIALGIQMNGQEQILDTYIKSVDKVVETILGRFREPWLIFDFLFKWTNLKKEQDRALKIVWDFSEDIIKKTKKELSQQTHKKRNDSNEATKFQSILDIFIEHQDENELSDLNLRQLIDNTILGAYDANITVLLFILLCIGSYPEVQRKVYEEVISVTGTTDVDILKEDLPKLMYVEAVINEVLRLYPPGTIVARTATSEVQLKDYILPDGCHVILHLAAVNRNKTYWGQDADEFRPERWFDALPGEFAAFASFSPGRRGCPGKNYALMNLKITVAKLVKKFHISGNVNNLHLEFVIFLRPTDGHLIKLELREQESVTQHEILK